MQGVRGGGGGGAVTFYCKGQARHSFSGELFAVGLVSG